MMTLQEALKLAQDHHQAGRLEAARRLYGDILVAAPDCHHARHLMGVVEAQTGRYEHAVILISQAIEGDDRYPTWRGNLCNSLQALGRYEEALAEALKWRAAAPHVMTSYHKLAYLCAVIGRYDALPEILEECFVAVERYNLFWKTPYYLVLDVANQLRARDGSLHLIETVIERALDVAKNRGDAPVAAWLTFLMGSVALLQGDSGRAERDFASIVDELPFVRHFASADDVRSRLDAVTPETRAAFDSALVMEPDNATRASSPSGSDQTSPVILAACNGAYLERFGRLLLLSIEAFCRPGQIVHFHVVDSNPKQQALLEKWRRQRLRVRFRFSFESSPSHLSHEDRRTFYSCVRFMRAAFILEHYRRPLLIVDIDALFLDDPMIFVSGLTAEAPLALSQAPDTLSFLYDSLGAGLAAVRPEPDMISYFSIVRDYLLYWLRRGEMSWFLDQIALICGRDACARRGKALNIQPISRRNGNVMVLNGGRYFQIINEKFASDFDQPLEQFLDQVARDLLLGVPPERLRASFARQFGLLL